MKSLSVKTFRILEFQIANSYSLNISSEANLCFMSFKTAATTRVKFQKNLKIKTFTFFSFIVKRLLSGTWLVTGLDIKFDPILPHMKALNIGNHQNGTQTSWWTCTLSITIKTRLLLYSWMTKDQYEDLIPWDMIFNINTVVPTKLPRAILLFKYMSGVW